ncbi:hypothetical protein D7030_10360 [Flavobacteriaceae bacterium AU392]|nr:hypothetical protein D1817_06450 [Flavobacteriaceae bacterium]RKM83689.1 hypothetical protein D7030_10360 [Flavobacteriaceae bacterium AU392]
MKKKLAEYRIRESADKFYKTIRTELNRSTFGKQFNLSGEYPDNGGINIYNTISFSVFKPNLGPLVKLNLICANTNQNGTESKLTLKRVNGATYKMQFWFMIFFVSLTLIIALYQIIIGNDIGFSMLKLPLFGLIYILIIELFSEFTINSLNKKVEKILNFEKLKYKKL